MKNASSAEIKKDLLQLSVADLTQICIRIARFKKENKELLNFLLYELDNETKYIEDVKNEIDLYFVDLDETRYRNLVKQIRKGIRLVLKFIKFSGSKNVEVAVLIHLLLRLKPYSNRKEGVVIQNMYKTQLNKILNTMLKLEEDLQFDYKKEIEELKLIPANYDY